MPVAIVQCRRSRQETAGPTDRTRLCPGGAAGISIQQIGRLAGTRPSAVTLIQDDRARRGGLNPIAHRPTAAGRGVGDFVRDLDDVGRHRAAGAIDVKRITETPGVRDVSSAANQRAVHRPAAPALIRHDAAAGLIKTHPQHRLQGRDEIGAGTKTHCARRNGRRPGVGVRGAQGQRAGAGLDDAAGTFERAGEFGAGVVVAVGERDGGEAGIGQPDIIDASQRAYAGTGDGAELERVAARTCLLYTSDAADE